MTWTLYEGHCLAGLAELGDASVSSVVTDPPYGLNVTKVNYLAVLDAWLRGMEWKASGRGFMGSSWDAFVPGPEVWIEVARVLKPGGHVVAFAGSRTYDLMTMAMRLGGLEVIDTLMWLYGQGFPKGMSVSRAMERQLGDDADPEMVARYEGWNTTLKPGWEPIVLARAPLAGGVVPSVLEHGTGALNIDGCRIAGVADAPASPSTVTFFGKGAPDPPPLRPPHESGRWPANVVLSHTLECEFVGVKEVASGAHWPEDRAGGGMFTSDASSQSGLETARVETETVEDWRCSADCPVRLLDEHTGDLGHGGVPAVRSASDRTVFGDHGEMKVEGGGVDTDSGGGSRFFYCAKATRGDRDSGMPDGVENNHPTVKPLDLMRWLVRLVTPADGIVLDPFAGSGTTGVAAMREGFDFAGMEKKPEFAEIARRRIGHAAELGHQAALF